MRTAFVFIAMMLASTAGRDDIPSILIGHWVVGTAQDVGQPIGLNADQENKIKGLSISLTQTYVRVCGGTVPIQSVNVDDLDPGQFLTRYHFSPVRIGLRGSHVTDVTINRLHSTHACGEFEDREPICLSVLIMWHLKLGTITSR